MNSDFPLLRGDIATAYQDLLATELLMDAAATTKKKNPAGDTTGNRCSPPTTPRPCPANDTTGDRCSQPTTPRPCKAAPARKKQRKAGGFTPVDTGWSLPPANQPGA